MAPGSQAPLERHEQLRILRVGNCAVNTERMPLLRSLSWFFGWLDYRHGAPKGAYQKEQKHLHNLFGCFLHFALRALRRPLQGVAACPSSVRSAMFIVVHGTR